MAHLSSILRLCAALFIGAVGIKPAFATGEVHCSASDGRSGTVSLNVGRLPVLNVLSAHVSAFGKTWSTRDGADVKVLVGQAFEDNTRMMVDFTDDNAETILIALRTVRMRTADGFAEAGILRIGKALYPVTCKS